MTRFTLLRMAANIVLDAVLGSVPVIGDVFDAVRKANRRNLALLERHDTAPSEAKSDHRIFVMLLGGLLVAICLALAFGGVVVTLRLLEGVAMRFQ